MTEDTLEAIQFPKYRYRIVLKNDCPNLRNNFMRWMSAAILNSCLSAAKRCWTNLSRLKTHQAQPLLALMCTESQSFETLAWLFAVLSQWNASIYFYAAPWNAFAGKSCSVLAILVKHGSAAFMWGMSSMSFVKRRAFSSRWFISNIAAEAFATKVRARGQENINFAAVTCYMRDKWLGPFKEYEAWIFSSFLFHINLYCGQFQMS